MTMLGLLVLGATSASSQEDSRPSNERIELPDFDSPGARPELELPPVAPANDEASPSSGIAILVNRFSFSGNTVFDSKELEDAIAGFTGRRITSEELIAAARTITLLYIAAGYATSGAVIPDQQMRDGVVRIEIVEGVLSRISVKETNRFRPGYFESRLARAGKAPLNVVTLEAMLQRFQQDPLVDRISARLQPGEKHGTSELVVVIKEARQDDVKLVAANDRSPSVGAAGAGLFVESANLLGNRDRVSVTGWFTEGLREVNSRYAILINTWDTEIEARIRYSRSDVVEYPFSLIDIQSESLSVSLAVDQPVYRKNGHEVTLGLTGEWRQVESTLSGDAFCFQPFVTDCNPTVAALRLRADWTWQNRDRAFAARSTFSIGLDVLGATTQSGTAPSGEFFTWLGQLQVAQRLPLSSRLIVRIDTQLTDDALLSFERIAVGGSRTVRGYRENQLVRDNGVVGSIEWRVPVWSRPFGAPYLEVAPFWDVGHAWNEGPDPGDNTISSVGLGLFAHLYDRVDVEVQWGGRLLGVNRVGGGLLGEGIHVRVIWDTW